MLLGNVYIISKVRVRDEDDYGLQTIIKDLPRSQAGLPIQIRALKLTLDGALPNGNTFMVNPTTCTPATTKITANSYASSKPVTTTASFTPTACDSEPFAPGMEIGDRPADARHGHAACDRADPARRHRRPRGLPGQEGRRALPVGTTLNPSLAPTLALCSDAQFGPQGNPGVKCPAASLVGHVAFDNPLLGTVPGDVYFGRSPGDPYRLLIIGRKAGVTVKIKASVRPDDDTGQITTIFDNLPKVPFTKFNLMFNGGPRGVVVTPPACGTYGGSITATPYSGGPSQTPTASFVISDDGQGGCAPKETPTIAGKMSSTQALGSGTLDLDIQRDVASRRPKQLDVALPPGLVGKVFSVPMCPTAKAQAGSCPSASRIGSVTTVVGSGPLPITLRGTAYLGTGTSTAIARIWLDIPVKVGPIDLGTFTLANALTLGKHRRARPCDGDAARRLQGLPARAAAPADDDRPQGLPAQPVGLRCAQLRCWGRRGRRDAGCGQRAVRGQRLRQAALPPAGAHVDRGSRQQGGQRAAAVSDRDHQAGRRRGAGGRDAAGLGRDAGQPGDARATASASRRSSRPTRARRPRASAPPVRSARCCAIV